MEKLILKIPRPLVCAENFRLHLLQFRRDETLATDRRLLARVMRRHTGQVRFRHLDEITKDRIEPHFQRLDAGTCNFSLLQLADPVLAVARSLPQRIKIDIVTAAENSALFQGKRRIVHDGASQCLGQFRHFLDFFLQTLDQFLATASIPACSKFRPFNQFL